MICFILLNNDRLLSLMSGGLQQNKSPSGNQFKLNPALFAARDSNSTPVATDFVPSVKQKPKIQSTNESSQSINEKTTKSAPASKPETPRKAEAAIACPLCHYMNTSLTTLCQHILNDHKLFKPFCISNLKPYQRPHSDFACKHCDFSTPARDKIITHVVEKHSQEFFNSLSSSRRDRDETRQAALTKFCNRFGQEQSPRPVRQERAPIVSTPPPAQSPQRPNTKPAPVMTERPQRFKPSMVFVKPKKVEGVDKAFWEKLDSLESVLVCNMKIESFEDIQRCNICKEDFDNYVQLLHHCWDKHQNHLN